MVDTGWLGPKTDQIQRASNLDRSAAASVLARRTFRYDKPRGNQQIIQRGNQQLVLHYERPRRPALVPLGVGMIAMLVLVLIVQSIGNVVGGWQEASLYGYPRMARASVVVGHDDSALRPSQFIFQNVGGQISVIELSGGDPERGHVYVGPMLLGSGMDKIPVTGEFKDENGDSKLDMILHIQNQRVIYLNDGKEFKRQ